jgi:5,5'-dehydrodivanillate O-demethylase
VPWYTPPTVDADGRPILDYVLAQDALVWYAQGPIADRTKELLGRTDVPIVLLRQQLDEQIRLVEEGKEPMNFFHESPDIIYGSGEPPDWSKQELMLKHNFRKLYHKGFANDDVDRYGPATELVKELHRRIEAAQIAARQAQEAAKQPTTV